ncbi:MAG: hypothetical protein ABR551_01080 [Gemmatimonadales bacterium]
MAALSTWAIRLALVQLLAAFLAGGWLLAARGIPSLPRPDWLLPVHLELALLGWTLQLAMGVAYWMLPKFKSGPPRGPTGPAIAALVVFNAGVLLVLASSVSGVAGLALVGRTGELAGVGLFAANALPRIKAFGR